MPAEAADALIAAGGFDLVAKRNFARSAFQVWTTLRVRPRALGVRATRHRRSSPCTLTSPRLHPLVCEHELEFARCLTRSTSSVPPATASTASRSRSRRRWLSAAAVAPVSFPKSQLSSAVIGSSAMSPAMTFPSWSISGRRGAPPPCHGARLRAGCPGIQASRPLRQSQRRRGSRPRVRIRHPGHPCAVRVPERPDRITAERHDGSGFAESLDCRGGQTGTDSDYKSMPSANEI